MPNQITAAGLEVATKDELVAFFTAGFQAIYGADINLDPDSPDGQWMNLIIQTVLDLEDLLVQINNQFDPDFATGNTLDERVAINGIQRQAGTYTITNITLIISQALNLYGLDQTPQPIYTVADNAGNQWELITSVSVPGAGTYAYAFRAATPGANLTVPNTITIPVTIVLGVTSINNPTTYTTLGINEESDAELRLRRQQSVSLASQGYLAGLTAALENINGITSVNISENTTGFVDADGTPSHSIWVIIAGTASNADIGTAIYNKRNAGCGMRGSQSYTITQVDGSHFTVYWDFVTPVPLFIKFTATSLNGFDPPRINDIRNGLVTGFVPTVFQQVNINDMATAVQVIDNNCLVTNDGFSLAATGPFTPTLVPAAKNQQFIVSAANVIIIPMILSPTTVALATLATQLFTPAGGFGAITYTIPVNASGGSISIGGLYTAGAVPGTDTVRATDSLGNFAEATVTVS